jgi:hypothetical protein
MNEDYDHSHMASKKRVGIAPLIMGIMIAGQSLPQLLRSGLSVWTVSSVIGGFAAIFVGLGILLEWEGFGTDTNGSSRTSTLVLAGIAVFSVGGGIILALV